MLSLIKKRQENKLFQSYRTLEITLSLHLLTKEVGGPCLYLNAEDKSKLEVLHLWRIDKQLFRLQTT